MLFHFVYVHYYYSNPRGKGAIESLCWCSCSAFCLVDSLSSPVPIFLAKGLPEATSISFHIKWIRIRRVARSSVCSNRIQSASFIVFFDCERLEEVSDDGKLCTYLLVG